MSRSTDPLKTFHPPVRRWFRDAFGSPTEAQKKAWPPIQRGDSTLLLAPTGSGKTLAAFLAAIDRLMFTPAPDRRARCKVVYVSPLKALAVDVERNLKVPLSGIAETADRSGTAVRPLTVAIRSGDTPASERTKAARTPPDIWITTPESLYLLLTSAARQALASVETVIVDEIHSMVATKRGCHLFLSLERLEALRAAQGYESPLQRIGLSATQRPVAEVARLLGGGSPGRRPGTPFCSRPVQVIDAGHRRPIDLKVEVPVEDMSNLAASSRPGEQERGSIWPSIYPRLVQLIREHDSCLIFVNSRRLSERLAAAINECAGQELALAHHGSVAREKRRQIEEGLKQGLLKAIVATSSLELGIDMGSVDLVVQIEAPPSIASGLQRIGRAGHSIHRTSRGILFPKFRGDLLASAAAVRRMTEGIVEEMFAPENPLDVLAQQIVAATAMDPWSVDELFALVRRAAPFSELPRALFNGVLDMLSGRYPSDDFAELRPRITWDRKANLVRTREGAQRIAVVNGGTIPDRGLYGVFLQQDEAPENSRDRGKSRRVGELDEEMVFESKPGDVFLLGASSWRIEDITMDRVLVRPAPGQPGRTPFWHGDRPGRPLEFGRAVGELTRTLSSLPREEAIRTLSRDFALDERAATNLVQYVRDQVEATVEAPSDRVLIVERYQDEMGALRVCVLSPFGSRIHAPWATAVASLARETRNMNVETLWSDDGIVFRLPETSLAPDIALFVPSPDDIEDRVVRELGGTSLFASRFRENAARALLLPRRRAGKRAPLWAQRQRAADLLLVASRYPDFPILLETYRECLRDVFDLPGLRSVLSDIRSGTIRVRQVDSRSPSPFAASTLFTYVANFIYDEDAPPIERRAQVLSVDQTQLRQLLGEAEMRELLDEEVIQEANRSLQRLHPTHPLKSRDRLHDLLLALGDLSEAEIEERAGMGPPPFRAWLSELEHEGRIIEVNIADERRFAAVEDAARLRDGLGLTIPNDLPESLLAEVAEPLGDLVSRYARTHGPFSLDSIAARFGIRADSLLPLLHDLALRGRLVEGTFLRRQSGTEYCDAEVMRHLKRRSLERLRRQIEPVPPETFARFSVSWQRVVELDESHSDLASAIDTLQGASIPASVLESDVLPARMPTFRPSDLDALCASGDLVLRGLTRLGDRDGRIALYWSDRYLDLAPPPSTVSSDTAKRVLELLERRGALFFANLTAETRLFPADLQEALWDLFWAGLITNDTWAPLRVRLAGKEERKARPATRAAFSRGPRWLAGDGRWSVLPRVGEANGPTETERRKALTEQLLKRHGVLTREAVQAEAIPGGFSAVYDVLKAMEEVGCVRRGYFVRGLGATQFALPGADELLRNMRGADRPSRATILAASDPANPFGAALPWPEAVGRSTGKVPGRGAGAHVILYDGTLIGYVGRTERTLLTFVPEDLPRQSAGTLRSMLVDALVSLASFRSRRALLLTQIDGLPASEAPVAAALIEAGFSATSRGLFLRGRERALASSPRG